MKKGKALCLLTMSAVLLTGCVDSMPELTKEQSGMIAEYAASLLLKYSPNYNYKIVSEEELAAAKASEQASEQEQMESQMEEETAAVEEPQTENGMQGSEDQQTVAEISTETVLSSSDVDIASELGIEDITIKYKSYELCDSYPQDKTGFSVSAAQGKKLLVIHFDLYSAQGENVECNLFDYNIKVRATVNDISNRALSTLLPNELMSYIDTVKAEPQDVVAVVELTDLSEDELTSFVLNISSNDGDCTIELK